MAVKAYLIDGVSMALCQPSLKDTTKDIGSLAVDRTALSCLMGVLNELGCEWVTEFNNKYDLLGTRHCISREEVYNRSISSEFLVVSRPECRRVA